MKKILIIEDEQLLREAFEFLLQAEGYDVRSVEHGKTGLTQLQKFKPDLILLDMLMPVMNGIEFLQNAELQRKYPNTKVIMLSNLSDPLPEASKYNVGKVLVKADLSPADLVSIVKNMKAKNRR